LHAATVPLAQIDVEFVDETQANNKSWWSWLSSPLYPSLFILLLRDQVKRFIK
jgi:hypothetical protein